jgi:hypothetical protein
LSPPSKTTTKKLSSLSKSTSGTGPESCRDENRLCSRGTTRIVLFQSQYESRSKSDQSPSYTVEKLRKDHFLAISMRGGHPPDPTCLRQHYRHTIYRLALTFFGQPLTKGFQDGITLPIFHQSIGSLSDTSLVLCSIKAEHFYFFLSQGVSGFTLVILKITADSNHVN